MEEEFTGVFELFKDIKSLINKDATKYSCVLPDGSNFVTPVMVQVEKEVKLDEINSSFTHIAYEQGTDEKYCALNANLVHGVDGFTVREITDRVNYNPRRIKYVLHLLKNSNARMYRDDNIDRLVGIAQKSEYTTARFFNLVNRYNVGNLPSEIRKELITDGENILRYPSSPVSTVHDQFETLPRSCNGVRFHYNEVLAKLATSEIAQSIMQDITGDMNLLYYKETDGKELASLIRNSNYGLS